MSGHPKHHKAKEHVPVCEWIRHGDGSFVLYRDGQRVDPFIEPDTYKQHEKDKPA